VFILGIYRGNIPPKSLIFPPPKKVTKLCKTISLRLLVTGLPPRRLDSALAFGARPPQTLSLPPKLAVNRVDCGCRPVGFRLVTWSHGGGVSVACSSTCARFQLEVTKDVTFSNPFMTISTNMTFGQDLFNPFSRTKTKIWSGKDERIITTELKWVLFRHVVSLHFK